MNRLPPELLALMNTPISAAAGQRSGKSVSTGRLMRLHRYAKDWIPDNMVYGTCPNLEEYIQQRVAHEVRRIEPDRSKAWAGREYPRELLEPVCIAVPWTIDGAVPVEGDRWMLTNQSDAQRNGVYVVLKSTYGYSEEPKRSTEDWIGSRGWFPNRWDHYRLHPNPPVARRTGRPK